MPESWHGAGSGRSGQSSDAHLRLSPPSRNARSLTAEPREARLRRQLRLSVRVRLLQLQRAAQVLAALRSRDAIYTLRLIIIYNRILCRNKLLVVRLRLCETGDWAGVSAAPVQAAQGAQSSSESLKVL